jgi:formiminoglutamase/agmatinase
VTAVLHRGRGPIERRIGIIGLPWDGGASLGTPGGRYGPAAIRAALPWWLDRIRDDRVWDVERGAVVDLSHLELIDLGDVEVARHDTETTFARATELVAAALRGGIEPLVLGGDHSITIPCARALDAVAGRFGVVQLDAHLDLIDDSPEQGRLSQSSPMRRAIELPGGAPERLVQVGLRSFNYPEFHDWCRAQGITQLTAAEALALGSAEVAERALAAAGDGAVYLTVDLDCLDPSVAPGVGHMEPGGFPFAFASDLVRRLAPRAAVVDIAELTPPADHGDMTANVAARLALDVIVAKCAARGPA